MVRGHETRIASFIKDGSVRMTFDASIFIHKKPETTHKHGIRHRGGITADDGNRTRLPSLGSWCSTNELHLHVVDYYNTNPTQNAIPNLKNYEKNFGKNFGTVILSIFAHLPSFIYWCKVIHIFNVGKVPALCILRYVYALVLEIAVGCL